ncbi:hypothetical protein BFJ65_g14431 [Fusarium oxysporum f. sp. cepae]|uniref:Uncharacterized protein n=3 Tax=Fusarium oxysporum TaxID=5507 RepID=A0A3L6MZB7_FUSOX|nr:hypothetical protein BFJ65_g14431 [Fusarium oxysporum f. sp. cepae]
MTNAHKECRGQIAGCDAGKCRTYDVYLDMLLGRLSRALDQQPRTRRPSGKHRESSTLELAAEHGRHGAFVSCRVWLRFAYNGTGRRVVKDGPHIQGYLPWTPSMNVAIDDQIDRSGLVIDRYRSTGSSDRSIDIDIESINRIDQIDWSIDFEACLAAAMALFKATCWKPTVRVLWILEPRQVCFGLSMTMDQITRCKELIKQHFPSFENPFKTLLNGDVKQQDIDDIKDLTKDDRKILEMAVKPKYGLINDAVLHARLSALDLATCLSEWSNNNPIEVLVDYESLEHIENPVNLHMHHHEELINRTENELKEYYDIMKKVLHFGRRTDNLRDWYNKCIWRLEHDKKLSDISVERLVMDNVLNRIRTAGSVRFLGGSSLRILQQFLDRDVASKIKCHLQVGSCDMSANLFSNQFNIALNQQAAKIVLSRSAEFAEFTVVPSHTAQSIKYSALGLKKFGGHCIEKRILGFNCHQEHRKIVTNQVSLEQQYSDKAYSMPDLTSFLCALLPGHMGSKPGFIEVDEQEGDTLLFKKSDKGIPMFDLDGVKELDEEQITAIFESLTRGEVLL